jgi:NADPH-dependent 7-cyano-7-deazaguanine reductase QueF
MEQKLYKLLQYSTVGWEVTHTKLQREECAKTINSLLVEGINPDYIKVELDNDT